MPDGIDHINIYSQGNTELGRLLSNWALTPFCCGDDGWFRSVEGYWYWLRTHNESLRLVHGYNAKKRGKELKRTILLTEEEFQEKIKKALIAKVSYTQGLANMIAGSTLPFQHYYVYNGKRVEAGYEWMTQYWEWIRQKLKDAGYPK